MALRVLLPQEITHTADNRLDRLQRAGPAGVHDIA